jgi:hypothetical protein
MIDALLRPRLPALVDGFAHAFAQRLEAWAEGRPAHS